jgi:hypothetical protein
MIETKSPTSTHPEKKLDVTKEININDGKRYNLDIFCLSNGVRYSTFHEVFSARMSCFFKTLLEKGIFSRLIFGTVIASSLGALRGL